jgi:hypothetical protein
LAAFIEKTGSDYSAHALRGHQFSGLSKHGICTLMRLGRDTILYILLTLIFLAYKIFEIHYPAIPFLHTYLEDLLAIPLILKTAMIIIQGTIERKKTIEISAWEILIITGLFSVYYELILPAFNDQFYSDPLDVICYYIGALFFMRFLRRNNGVSMSNLT